MSSKSNLFVKWWLTPKLVKQYQGVSKGKDADIGIYIKHWLAHPIKRRLAKYYSIFLRIFTDIKVIGITGSCGKTTTKEMLASILRLKGKAVASVANIDPVFNIPTTILKARKNTKYLILEMGVEYRGEMDFYLWFGKPDIGVITNIYPTHTEFFKNVKGVLKEKSGLVKSLEEKDTVVLNSDDKHIKEIAEKVKARIILFGKSGDIKAKDWSINNNVGTDYTLVINQDKISVQLPIIGYQFVENSLAAASIAHVLGIDIKTIKKGLESYTKPKHRMRPIRHKSGALILDDSYNNNPEAAIAAIDTLCEVAEEGTKVVVMGDMLELGDLEEKEHRRVGKYIAEKGIDSLIGVGMASKLLVDQAEKKLGKDNVFWVSNQKKVYPLLQKFLKQNTTVLIKGSRSIELDKLVIRLS